MYSGISSPGRVSAMKFELLNEYLFINQYLASIIKMDGVQIQNYFVNEKRMNVKTMINDYNGEIDFVL